MIALLCRGPARRVPVLAVACAASVVCWFVVDSAWSALHGGGFNVLLVNVPALVVVFPPLAEFAMRSASR